MTKSLNSEEVTSLKDNIELGRKCLIVLRYDIEHINNNIADLEAKIQKRYRTIRNFERGSNEPSNENKSYDEMTVHELERE